MADVLGNDVSNEKNHDEDESQYHTQKEEEGADNHGNGKQEQLSHSHSNSTISSHSNQEKADDAESKDDGDSTECEGWGSSSREVTPTTSPALSIRIPPGLAPLVLPEHSAYTPRAAPNTPVPLNHHDDHGGEESPSLATGGGYCSSDPPIIVGPDPDNNDAVIVFRKPAPIYPLALEIPRISEPDDCNMDTYERIPDGCRTPDLESGRRRGGGFSHHSRANSDVSTPHSPVRFKEPITEPITYNIPDPDSDRPDPGTGTSDELLFPGFVPVVFRCLTQRTGVRYWCLKAITWPYPFFYETQ